MRMQVKMVTGDQRLIAIETSRRLGLGTNIMEGTDLMHNNTDAAALAIKACISHHTEYTVLALQPNLDCTPLPGRLGTSEIIK